MSQEVDLAKVGIDGLERVTAGTSILLRGDLDTIDRFVPSIIKGGLDHSEGVVLVNTCNGPDRIKENCFSSGQEKLPAGMHLINWLGEDRPQVVREDHTEQHVATWDAGDFAPIHTKARKEASKMRRVRYVVHSLSDILDNIPGPVVTAMIGEIGGHAATHDGVAFFSVDPERHRDTVSEEVIESSIGVPYGFDYTVDISPDGNHTVEQAETKFV